MMVALSWRHRFLLLILITLLGLGLMTFSAFRGLSQVSSSYEHLMQATAYETASQRLLAHWLRIENLSSTLSEDNRIELQNSLNTLTTSAGQMAGQAGALDDQDLTDGASGIVENVKRYTDLRQHWLDNRRKLGFDGDTSVADPGLAAEVKKETVQLDAIGEMLASQIEMQSSVLHDGVMASASERAASVRRTSNWLMIGTSLGVAVFLLLTLGQISRTLNRRLRTIRELLSKVAAGDLTAAVTLGRNRRDEFNQLGEAANGMVEEMAALIRRLVDGNRELSELHRLLDDTRQQLGTNSEQVEQQTEQAASATHQISMTVNDVARRALEVSQASQQATEAAEAGAGVITGSVDAMQRLAQLIQDTHEHVGRLEASGARVNGIIDMINGLADQTNLLALNAAIEAARAGDAGRGFSVVADEVRSLAQKTMSATTGISAIIREFSQQTREMAELMENGLQLAGNGERSASSAAEAIDRITGAISTLSVEMEQVVVAVEQISATTDDIAAKMEHIHRHTGETKTLRLGLNQHSQRLADQTRSLNDASNRFHILG